MKRFFTILALAAMVVGCSKDIEVAQQPTLYTLTGYSDINTRTAFGTPNDSSIPFVWSAGDYVSVGGNKSNAIEEGGSTATFTFKNEPQEGATVYYNMKGLGAIAIIPTEQNANQSLGLNGDFGYATVSNGSFTLNHATAYLWFDVTRANGELEGATLESITIDAADAVIAGTAKWNGSAFNNPTQSYSTITLTVGKELATANEGVMAAAVVLPTELSKLTLTYEFTVGSKTKYYKKVIEKSRTLVSGHTYRIAVEGLKASDLIDTDYDLRVLTFEGDYWDSMVDNKQMNGDILYGGDFSWYDTDNTELCHYALEGGALMFWGGGHAISNYSEPYYSPDYLDEYLNNYYDPSELSGWEGWQFLQLMTPIGARSGDNFAVHFGYYDYNSNNNMCMSLAAIEFQDGTERVIDHMYVTNTNYALNQICYGVSREDDNGSGDQFGGNYGGISPDTYLKIIAYGYNEEEAGMDSGEDYLYNPADNENVTKAEFYLVKDGEAVLDWQKWDLSVLGPVVKVKFNFEFSEDMGGNYGFTIPAYFAYDDVAVRVTK